jgi:hypothetical protein
MCTVAGVSKMCVIIAMRLCKEAIPNYGSLVALGPVASSYGIASQSLTITPL